MVEHLFRVKEKTFAIVTEDSSRHINVSIINGSDGSGYLILNSSNSANPDYIKITYHPRSNELIYEFTNEFWKSQNKPNSERKKFVGKPTSPNQVLALVYIDKGALFKDSEIDKDRTQIVFPKEGVIEVQMAFENSKLVVNFRKIPEFENVKEFISKSLDQVYDGIPGAKVPGSGCVQALLTGNELPLRIVIFGV